LALAYFFGPPCMQLCFTAIG